MYVYDGSLNPVYNSPLNVRIIQQKSVKVG